MTKLLSVPLALLLAQGSPVPPTDLLGQSESLSQAEIATLGGAVGELLVGKTFFAYGGFGGGTVTVGVGPRVRTVHYRDRVIEWTGLPARTCDGHDLEGGLVVEWERTQSGWEPAARASAEPRIFDALFGLWSLPSSSIQDAGSREIAGIQARGLRYPYEAPPGSQFEASWQSLWFDPRTGLPIRYEIEISAPEEVEYGYFLAYAPGWEGGPAGATQRPECVSTSR